MRRRAAIFGGVTLILVAAVSARADEARSAPDGKPIFLKYKCTGCHSIESQGLTKKSQAAEEGEKPSTRKPPDLSGVGLEHRADWIRLYLTKEGDDPGPEAHEAVPGHGRGASDLDRMARVA